MTLTKLNNFGNVYVLPPLIFLVIAALVTFLIKGICEHMIHISEQLKASNQRAKLELFETWKRAYERPALSYEDWERLYSHSLLPAK